ncbi:lactococcin 972 family bacteriocin [Nocardiopsis sp. ATB16-24]|uniref:lactococcin 972 family bacteriocin n=1 Tax=Nocardiopsis sp. ATB16-24 TaxID=3019555 RepID=UPI002554DF8D|nr:lactococcin 972 family bacteriocin [Nocardiopsis sp. ATB16-24]
MNALKKAMVTLAVAAGLTAGTAGVASAATEYVGGGTWWHGLTASTVYSDYFHATRCHGSTAVGTYTVRSTGYLPGYTSKATAPRALYNNETYWRHCG